jgi:hypothetical protein
VGALLFAESTAAQVSKPDFSFAASVAAVTQLKTDIKNGGDFQMTGGLVSAVLGWQVTPAFSTAVTFRYGYEDWRFSSSNALSAAAPWGAINSPGIGLNFKYQHAPDLSFFLAPQIRWNYETGADAGKAQSYGAAMGVTKVFSPTLTVGIGAGVVRQIDKTRALPVVLVSWQINDKWRLGNTPPGAAGGPGLELVYAIDNAWEIAGGGGYRDSRFRLRSDGPSSNGIGEDKGAPLMARLSRKLGPQGKVDLYAGAVVGGKLKLMDTNGNTMSSSDYKASPLLGLSVSMKF